MSYEISLYRREFLDRAIREQLGDWTGADPIPEPSRLQAATFFEQRGYVEESYPWSTGRCFKQPSQPVEATIYIGCISFAVHHSEQGLAALEAAKHEARALGQLLDLAAYDPQEGQIL